MLPSKNASDEQSLNQVGHHLTPSQEMFFEEGESERQRKASSSLLAVSEWCYAYENNVFRPLLRIQC